MHSFLCLLFFVVVFVSFVRYFCNYLPTPPVGGGVSENRLTLPLPFGSTFIRRSRCRRE